MELLSWNRKTESEWNELQQIHSPRLSAEQVKRGFLKIYFFKHLTIVYK